MKLKELESEFNNWYSEKTGVPRECLSGQLPMVSATGDKTIEDNEKYCIFENYMSFELSQLSTLSKHSEYFEWTEIVKGIKDADGEVSHWETIDYKAN